VEVDLVNARRMRWFLPDTPDVLGTLGNQSEATTRGLEALVAWANGDAAAAEHVREWEHRADQHKRSLQRVLRTAFSTPLDAEDVYALSDRLDYVINGAKDAVREAEVMAIGPDATVAGMAALLLEGARHLDDAFRALAAKGARRGTAEATDAADAAVRSQREAERVYRTGMSALLEVADLREVVGRRELYRRFSRVSEDLVEVAERVWYTSVKEA
jgi:uncharacterized protein Yka (UPF0111/DUF47 family)